MGFYPSALPIIIIAAVEPLPHLGPRERRLGLFMLDNEQHDPDHRSIRVGQASVVAIAMWVVYRAVAFATVYCNQ